MKACIKEFLHFIGNFVAIGTLKAMKVKNLTFFLNRQHTSDFAFSGGLVSKELILSKQFRDIDMTQYVHVNRDLTLCNCVIYTFTVFQGEKIEIPLTC